MANPQKENGYTAIANEIVDKLCSYQLSGGESTILWAVLRKTYGWNKSEDYISLSQFCLITGWDRSNVAKTIKKLVAKRILGSVKGNTSTTSKYWLNKDFYQWIVANKPLPLSSGKRTTTPSGNSTKKLVAIRPHTKDNTKAILKQEDFPYLQNTSFKETFNNFIEMRRLKKKPATDFAKKLILDKLHKEKEEIAILILEQSIVNSWQDIFPLKKEYKIERKMNDLN